MNLLSIENLSIAFDQQTVVDKISFALESGEKFALVGESGSGKTVTASSILRLLPARISGRIDFSGEDLLALSEAKMRAIRGKRIAMIFQEPMSALNPLMRIGHQITEVLELHEAMPYPAARERAIELLSRTGIPEAERRFNSYPHELSGGQRQRAMIAMALACRPQLLIADEPTTALDVTIRAQIMALLDELQQEFGMAILLITHDLNLVRRFAQRVGVMQQGKLVEINTTAVLFQHPQHDYTRRLLASRPQPLTEAAHDEAPIVLKGDNIRVEFSYPDGWFKRKIFVAVEQASLQLRKGETLGIVGESGSGKTTLAMSLLRLQSKTQGQIVFRGQALDTLPTRNLRSLRAHMQVVFQDPFSSLSPRMTIEQIVGEGLALHQPQQDKATHRQRIVDTLIEVGLHDDCLPRYPHEFSGGQRQRIAIARAIILQPALVVLDEPTSALDVSVQKQVLELLAKLQRKYGMSYLFISHDLEVIRAMAHRTLVMQNGVIVEAGKTSDIFAQPRQAYTQKLLSAALGSHSPPIASS